MNKITKPWISRGLLKSISTTKKKVYVRSRTSDKLNLYKTYENKLTPLLRISKKQCYEALLAKNKNVIKSTGKILNCVINWSKRKPIKISSIQDHDVTITNSEETANRFCQYFANFGPNLASKITPLSKSFSKYLTQVTSSSLQNFDLVQMNELDEIVKCIKEDKAQSWSGQSAYVYH